MNKKVPNSSFLDREWDHVAVIALTEMTSPLLANNFGIR